MPTATEHSHPSSCIPHPSVAGAILAGGRSSRMGRDKALLELNGEPLLARALRTLGRVCAEVIVVGPRDRETVVPGVRVVPDERPGAGPLGAIASALRAVAGDRVLIVATDMPLLNTELLRYLVELSAGYDVTIPRVEGRTQQLHAVYARSCLPVIDEQLARDEFKIDRFFDRVRLRVVEEGDVRRLDPRLHSFRNINTEQDWSEVQAIAAATGSAERGR